MVHDPGTDGIAADEVLIALHRATHASLQALISRLAGLALNPSEINVLAVLADERKRTVGEIAAATATRPTTLTSVLDRLSDRGLIRRALHPVDRRSVQISLTAGGRRAAKTVQAEMQAFARAALADVTPADLAGFHAVALALTEAVT